VFLLRQRAAGRWFAPEGAVSNTMLKHRGVVPRGWGREATKERGRDGASFSERGKASY